MADRKVLKTCVLLFAAAVVVRLAASVVMRPGRPPVGDETDYLSYATSIANGGDYAVSSMWARFELGSSPLNPSAANPLAPYTVTRFVSFRTPLLPLLMAPVATLGGGIEWMRLANLVLGSLCPPLFYLALRRSPIASRAVWPAAALVVWPPAVFLSLQLLAEPLAMALVLGAIAVRPDRPGRVIPEWQSCVAGILGGLAILARPASLVTAAFLAAARGTRRRALWFAIGASLLVAPWVVRNTLMHGRPLLTTNTGMTLVGSNCAAALAQEWPGKWVGMSKAYAGATDPPDRLPQEFGWETLGEAGSDRRFAADAWRWIREHPGDFVRLCGWKLVRLFDPDQHSEKDDAGLKRRVGSATFAPVLALALAGAWFAWKDRRAWAAWWAIVAGTLVTTLVFYGDVRMRSPMDPALLAFATLALTRLLARSTSPGGGDAKT